MTVQFAPLAFSKRLALIVLTALLAGCPATTAVRQTDPRIGAVIHQCFATVKEAIFLSTDCQPMFGYAYCDTVRSLDPEPHPNWQFPQFPPSLQAFRDDRLDWTRRIHEAEQYRRGHGGIEYRQDRVVIYGGLPVGTQIEIVQVSRWFNGENGTFWIAYAVILDGEFKGRQILLPWPGTGEWIVVPYDRKTREFKDPEVDSRFLTQCEAKAIGPVSNSQ